MIISKTPYRISFFGGGSDYPLWYMMNGGSVLSTTIDKYIYISCRYLPPFFEHKYRVVWSQVENVKTIEISTQDQDTSSEHSDLETDTPPVNVVKTEETKQETNNDGVYQNLMNQISKEEESIDFKKLKMKDLKNLCQKRGLSRYSHLKKNELINLLSGDD